MDECARPRYHVLRSRGGSRVTQEWVTLPWREGATSGMVTWRDVMGPGERLDPPRPAGKSGDRSRLNSFCLVAALGVATIGLQRQSTWHASIVRPGPTCAIGRTAEICTEIA